MEKKQMSEEKIIEEKVEIDYTKWNIFKKLARARVIIANCEMKKSGKNQRVGWSYFELQDIIPPMLKVFDEIGLIGIEGHEDPVIDPNTGIQVVPEKYTLKIYNTDRMEDKPIVFTKKQADARTQSQLPIQAVGSESTYMRRYLWMDALEIVENDIIDNTAGMEGSEPVKPTVRMASKPQITILKKAYPDPTAVFQWAGVTRWEDLTAEIASRIIARKKLGEEKGGDINV
jgi:hypothetical protein